MAIRTSVATDGECARHLRPSPGSARSRTSGPHGDVEASGPPGADGRIPGGGRAIRSPPRPGSPCHGRRPKHDRPSRTELEAEDCCHRADGGRAGGGARRTPVRASRTAGRVAAVMDGVADLHLDGDLVVVPARAPLRGPARPGPLGRLPRRARRDSAATAVVRSTPTPTPPLSRGTSPCRPRAPDWWPSTSCVRGRPARLSWSPVLRATMPWPTGPWASA